MCIFFVAINVYGIYIIVRPMLKYISIDIKTIQFQNYTFDISIFLFLRYISNGQHLESLVVFGEPNGCMKGQEVQVSTARIFISLPTEAAMLR